MSSAGTERVPSSTGVVVSAVANDRSTEAAGGSYPSKQPIRMAAEHCIASTKRDELLLVVSIHSSVVASAMPGIACLYPSVR